MIREKHTKSGPLLEVDFYPVFSDGRRMPTRAPKAKPSTAEQARYNKRQLKKKIVRLVNANFDNTDIFMHPTYIAEMAPQTLEEARRDIVNYLRRVKTWRAAEIKRLRVYLKEHPDDERARKNLKKLEQPFKYIYVIECVHRMDGTLNWHFHMFITGGGDGDRDQAEKMWRKGIKVNAARFQPEKFGPEAAARYISKDPKGSKRFACSMNLIKPIVPKPKDGKTTRRAVERMAKERADDTEYWERKYKGYKFLRCYPRPNQYNGHWYITIVMYKCGDDMPEWQDNDWSDEW